MSDKRTLLVVGDVFLDRTIHGEMTRISPEAPAPVVRQRAIIHTPGGAGNVAANIRELTGLHTNLLGIVGKDEDGKRLCALVAATRVEGWFDNTAPETITKTRIVVNGYQVLRVDTESAMHSEALPHVIADHLDKAPQVAAVVVADYAKGAIDAATAECLLQWTRYRQIPLLVDTKPCNIRLFAGATVIKINLKEALTVLADWGVIHPALALGGLAAGEVAAQLIQTKLPAEAVVITCAKEGAAYAMSGRSGTVPQPECVVRGDVTGAGDVFMAGLVAAYLSGCGVADACSFASLAATASVRKIGTAVITLAEVDQELLHTRGWPAKIMGLERAKDVTTRQRAAGQEIILVNGCFDVLHAGHIQMLAYAKQLGGYVVAACNDDVSVQALKGAHRPFVDAEHRQAQLAMQPVVDAVVTFNGDVEALVRQLRPQVLVKGAENQHTVVPGADWVVTHGGRLVFAPMLPGVHTSQVAAGGP